MSERIQSTAEFPVLGTALDVLLTSALSRSAHEGARIVALHWLHELVIARQAWSDAVDSSAHSVDPSSSRRAATTALHKARVALRRLRATLREHRLTLDLDEGDRAQRAFRRLGKSTNALRDSDVQREWLDAERDALTDGARREADAMLLALGDSAADEVPVVSRAFARDLDRHVARVARRLSRFRLPMTVGQRGVAVPFARHLADRVDRSAAHLRHDIGMVDDVDAQDALHRIRLRLKRQRAMLAPFARVNAEVSAWYAMATEGQDLLGAMRDASLLADLADREGYRHLERTLRDVALGHFNAFHARWCADADATVACREAASHSLRVIAESSSDTTAAPIRGDTLPAGHGLPMEIERKFLLHGLPPEAAMAPSMLIEQGWLPGSMLRERLRRTMRTGAADVCTRTVKLGPAGARIEIEEPTDSALFAAMWPLTAQARIRKRRHVVRDGALTWEVDVFLDRDLVLAEVELQDVASDISASLPIPAWLATFIVREVTQEPAYFNSVMAQPDPAAASKSV